MRSTKLFCLVSAVSTWIAACAVAAAETFTARVISVSDGDSLTIADGSQDRKVILYGIDCPERDQPFGEDARKYTDERCWHKSLTFENRGKDSLGRMVAVVWLPDGTSLNEDLVQQGLAWWSDKYAPGDKKLKALHESAKSAHIGLWSAPNPIPPWIWRNGQKSVQAIRR